MSPFFIYGRHLLEGIDHPGCANGTQNFPNEKFRWRLACAICAIHSNLQGVYKETGPNLTIVAGPGTGRKKVNGTQFSVWIFRLGIHFGNFPFGQTNTVQPKYPISLYKMLNTSCHQPHAPRGEYSIKLYTGRLRPEPVQTLTL